MAKLLTLIVTYNGMKWMDKCISSISSSSIHSDILVIDNNSSDGTPSYLESKGRVIVFRNNENLGFAKANNIGLKYALDNGYDYVFLLNQDAWVEKGTLECLVKTFEENDDVGVASPIHLDGSRITLDYGFANYVQGDFVMDLYKGTMKAYYHVPFINAAAWMISRKCLEKIGGFDTLLFTHYEEDQNYCQRITYHGLKLLVNTECTICHDREQRNDSLYEGRVLWEKQNYYSRDKLDWGNINWPIDIRSKKIKNILRIFYFSLFLQWKKVRRIIKENQLLNQITMSRETNKQTGPAWL